MIKQSLYDISEEILSILGTEEWTDETEAQLEKLSLAMEVKAGKILDYCSNLDAFVSAAKEEEKRLADRRKAAENRIKQLHNYIKQNMESIERTELEAGTRKLKIQKNPHSVVIDNEQQVPAKFFVVIPATTQLDKKAIADAIKSGEEVEGAHIEQSTRLVVR